MPHWLAICIAPDMHASMSLSPAPYPLPRVPDGPWSLAHLRHCARDPACDVTRALAGVMAMATTRPAAYSVPVAGLRAEQVRSMLDELFPRLSAPWPVQAIARDPLDEFDDLLMLLMVHAKVGDRRTSWLAHAIATACMGANHLWQDMGLPDRGALGTLIATHFPALKQCNNQDMRWKKFFYRELCARADVPICKSPSCAQCVDQAVCFAPEAGAALLIEEPHT